MADRGRETSGELVEIRTVLSRAETAREVLIRYRENETTRKVARAGHWDYSDPGHPRYVADSYAADPDIEEMIEALDTLIESLARWRRKGRGKRS